MDTKFSTDERNALRDAFQNNESLIISGVNAFGQPFKVVGKISPHSNGNAAIYFYKVFFEFGNEYISDEINHTKWAAPYHLNLEVSKHANQLVVLSIEKKSGEKIYEAKNVAEIMKNAMANQKLFLEDKKNLKINSLDPVTKKLQNLVGCPVTLEGYATVNGVLSNVMRVDPQGRPMVQILSSTVIAYTRVHDITKLYTINENNELEKIADNSENVALVQKCFEENAPKVEKNMEEEL